MRTNTGMYVVVGERCTECYAVVSPSPSPAKPKVPTQSSSLTDRFRRGGVGREGSSGWVWGVGKGGVGSRGQRERESRRYIKLRVLTGGGGDLLGPLPLPPLVAALTRGRGQRFCLADKKVSSCRVSGRGLLEGVFPQVDASLPPTFGRPPSLTSLSVNGAQN